MKRRTFLKTLASIAGGSIVGVTVAVQDENNDDPFKIMGPDEISKLPGVTYISTPVLKFKFSKMMLHAKTIRLKFRIHDSVLRQPKERWIKEARYLASLGIRDLKLTHVHAVRFFESPADGHYHGFVRGCRFSMSKAVEMASQMVKDANAKNNGPNYLCLTTSQPDNVDRVSWS
jgi:hypothetical protein